jgi:hypothetical protein
MSALRWVHDHAEELGVDPERVAVGHLCGIRRGDPPRPYLRRPDCLPPQAARCPSVMCTLRSQ